MRRLAMVALTMALGWATAVFTACSQREATAGPNGGDLVALEDGTVQAEVIRNPDTGEVMVHTWDSTLQRPQPLAAEPMTLGSGDERVELEPHPILSDPPGRCSRFYGQADWIRRASDDEGWLECCGGRARHEFAWRPEAGEGRVREGVWSELGEHRRGPMGRRMGEGH